MELYRYLIDDFLIQYSQNLRKKDFITKSENYSSNRKGKREYLNHTLTTDLTRKLYDYFESKVEIPRIQHGSRQTIETLVHEEAYLLAKYLIGEGETWKPRTPKLKQRLDYRSVLIHSF